MKYNYFPDYENVRERLENLVTKAETNDFGDLDLEMEALYFNIYDQLNLLRDKLKAANIEHISQVDDDLKELIKRAVIILTIK